MTHNLKGRDLISISDLTKSEIIHILHYAAELRDHPHPDLCKGSILASCFFEPSTRTRLSFEAAMLKLGGSCVGFSGASTTSVQKGETLHDTIKVVSGYCDILVMRHPLEGSARLAADVSEKPLINAGDGTNQHPTQTLLDLFTIQECQHKIDGLSIAIAGDLKHGRTVHSLALALAINYQVRLYFISSEELQLPETIVHELRKRGVKFSFHTSFDEVIPKVDILYMTRLQKERLTDPMNHPSILTMKNLTKAKASMRILHPLPRVDEIDPAIDHTHHAYYFKQAQNGLYVRMALLAMFLGKWNAAV